MKTSPLVTLLSVSALVGVGLAVYLGLTTHGASAPGPAERTRCQERPVSPRCQFPTEWGLRFPAEVGRNERTVEPPPDHGRNHGAGIPFEAVRPGLPVAEVPRSGAPVAEAYRSNVMAADAPKSKEEPAGSVQFCNRQESLASKPPAGGDGQRPSGNAGRMAMDTSRPTADASPAWTPQVVPMTADRTRDFEEIRKTLSAVGQAPLPPRSPFDREPAPPAPADDPVRTAQMMRAYGELAELKKPLEPIGTRLLLPRHITRGELEMALRPLLSRSVGGFVSLPHEVTRGEPSRMILIRDYVSSLAMVDEALPQIDALPLQVNLDVVFLTVELADDSTDGVRFEELYEKKFVSAGWPVRVNLPPAFRASRGGLKFAFLETSQEKLVEELKATGSARLFGIGRAVVVDKACTDLGINPSKGLTPRPDPFGPNAKDAKSQTADGKKESSHTKAQNAAARLLGIPQEASEGRLRLCPTLFADGAIRIEIHSERPRRPGDPVVDGSAVTPTVPETSICVVVPSGATAVLGGMFRQATDVKSNVTALQGEPRPSLKRREVLALLTPRTIGPGTMGMIDATTRPVIARQYIEAAQEARQVGNRDAMARFVELAMRFDPADRVAIDLRNRLWFSAPTAPVMESRFAVIRDPLADPNHAQSNASPNKEMPPPPGGDMGRIIPPGEASEAERRGIVRGMNLSPLIPVQAERRTDSQWSR